MNPVLVKPEGHAASQVVVQGRVDAQLCGWSWRDRSERLAVAARESFRRLAARHQLLIIEGAGSPAEINLAAHDYVNLHAARWASDACTLQSLLVADIDRGGAFAHLYGTWLLLPQDLRATLAGFVLNKFRGDARQLAPRPDELKRLTGVPMAGVLPMHPDHGLPDEDGVFDDSASGAGADVRLSVAIVATPHISNLDELQPLRNVPGLRLIWARTAAELHNADLIVLPGSKHVSGDLHWLRTQGLDVAICRHAARGCAILGICGGLQMLARRLYDPEGIDGEWHTVLPGLDLLPLATHYDAVKRVVPGTAGFAATSRHWAPLSGVSAPSYEMRHGVTRQIGQDPACAAVLFDAHHKPVGWQAGPVLGVCVHGLFESAAVMRALFGADVRSLDSTFDTLAELVDRHLDAALLVRLALKEDL